MAEIHISVFPEQMKKTCERAHAQQKKLNLRENMACLGGCDHYVRNCFLKVSISFKSDAYIEAGINVVVERTCTASSIIFPVLQRQVACLMFLLV